MSGPADLPRKRPRPTLEQKAEWDAAFAEATGKPVVDPEIDPETERVYGILALCVVAFGTVVAGSFAWVWLSFAVSACFASAAVGSHLAKRSSSNRFGQHAAKWSFWLYVALIPGGLVMAIQYGMQLMRVTSLFHFDLLNWNL